MAQISVRYFGMLRDIVGKRNETVALPDSSNAVDVINYLSKSHGSKFKEFVFDSDGKIREGITFAVDGSSVQQSSLSKIKCMDISEFVILPPISGGV